MSNREKDYREKDVKRGGDHRETESRREFEARKQLFEENERLKQQLELAALSG